MMTAGNKYSGLALALLLAAGAGGCSARSAGRLAGKTIHGIGSLTAKTASATVRTAGHVTVSVAKTAIHTSGSVVSGVATASLVTFKDTATGVSREIPYSEGLRLYAASQTAHVQAGLAAYELLRNGRPMAAGTWASVKPGTAHDPALRAGDVIRLHRPAHPKRRA